MAPTAVLAPAALHTCDDASCAAATSHRDTCKCRCGGRGHGAPHRAGIARAITAHVGRADRHANGFTAAMLAADTDEAW